jgi:hypothetical protein
MSWWTVVHRAFPKAWIIPNVLGPTVGERLMRLMRLTGLPDDGRREADGTAGADRTGG